MGNKAFGSFKSTKSFKDVNDKGFFNNSAELLIKYPTANSGDWARIGETGSFWMWDESENAWKESENLSHGKGFFETSALLVAEYPTGEAGDWAIVGATDTTIWVWDTDTNIWKDTGHSSITDWGDIGGDITDQTDLDINAINDADGKKAEWDNKLSLDQTTPQEIINGVPKLITTNGEISADRNNLINRDFLDKRVRSGGGFLANVYFRTDDSDKPEVGDKYKRIDYVSESSETELSAIIKASDGEVLVRTYLFDLPLGTTILDAGIYTVNYRAKVSGLQGVTNLGFKARVYKADDTVVDIFPNICWCSELNNTDYLTIRSESNHPTYTVESTDRFLVEIYARTTHSANITINTIVGGENASYFSTPIALRHNLLRERDGENAHPATSITEDETHRFVTDTEKSTWNGKQDNLGFTPEDSANKTSSFQVTPDDIKFPTEKLVKDSLNTIETRDNLHRTLIQEPTGVKGADGDHYNQNISLTYNTATNKIEISSAFQIYNKGVLVVDFDGTGIWESPEMTLVPAVSGVSLFFLFMDKDDSVVKWSASPWSFADAQIAFAVFLDGNFLFAQREVHGFQPWQSHATDHEALGAYIESGGDISGVVEESITATERRPLISNIIHKDEDLKSLILEKAVASDYTRISFGTAGALVTAEDQAEIVALNGVIPQYNAFDGTDWSLADITNNSYVSVWLLVAPTTDDNDSRKYRHIFVQGQSFGTLDSQRSLNPASIYQGDLIALSPENVFTKQFIIRRQGGDWHIAEIRDITGTRVTQVTSAGGNFLTSVSTDASIRGQGTVSSPLSVFFTDKNEAGDYTLDEGDEFHRINLTLNGNQTITVPEDSTFNFAVNTEILIQGLVTGTKTISPDAGVSINGVGTDFVLDSQYSSAVLRKIGADEWLLIGGII